MHCKMCQPILSQHYKKKCWGKNSMAMVFKNFVFLVGDTSLLSLQINMPF